MSVSPGLSPSAHNVFQELVAKTNNLSEFDHSRTYFTTPMFRLFLILTLLNLFFIATRSILHAPKI